MSEEYTHVGSVRRRPRTGHQRSQPSPANGEAKTNGFHSKNGRDTRQAFEREDPLETEENEPRESRETRESREARRPRPRSRFSARKESRADRKALPNYGPELDEEPLFRFPFDPWRLYGAAKRNFGWIIFAGLLLAVLGFVFATYMVQYKVNLSLIRTTPNAVRTEGAPIAQFMPREYSEQTVYAFMKSGEVFNRVVEKAKENPLLTPLNVTPEKLSKAVSIRPTPNPDFVQLSMETFGGLRAMVELANLYGNEVTEFTREIQRREAVAINELLQEQLKQAGERILQITTELKTFSDSGFVDFDKETETQIATLVRLGGELQEKRLELERVEARIKMLGGSSAAPTTRLEQAREELKALLVDKKPAHPDVEKKQAEIKRFENMPDGGGAASGTGVGMNPLMLSIIDLQATKPTLEKHIQQMEQSIAELNKRLAGRGQITKDIEFEIKKAELKQQEKSRDALADKERESRDFIEGSRGYFAVHQPATLSSIGYKNRWMKVSLLAIFAGLVGIFGATALVMLSEMLDTSIRTPEDINRITKLPVLATLGDLRKMSAAQQVTWAFRTLTILKGKLSRDADQALVCGIISANHGEGRSTWVNLLVSAASQRGLRVLTVDTKSTTSAPSAAPAKQEEPVAPKREQAAHGSAKESPNGQAINLPDHPQTPENNVLSAPAKVAEQLEDPNSQALVHIPLPGWVWNLERRKQWQKALDHWKDIDNLVIFVELPPASEQEAVLLAEHLPQVIWLTGSGMADAAETTAHLETLRHARCNLVGAVLNHAPPPFLNHKIMRWFSRTSAALLLCSFLSSGIAAESESAATAEVQFAQAEETQPNASFSASSKRKRAKWQERLTLGPGDIIDIHFYGNPALSRTNVFIGPDGRISYLQANGTTAAGLTVEELRQKLDQQLSEFYTAPRTIVIPVAFNSKKYFMLGKVNAKGAYPLDRPLTLLEAVARAKGLETGLYQRTTVEMADLGRSFIVRENEKLDVDFSRLFLEGDLSQNIAIEPNDYIFFASTGASDIYVLGEVMLPGPLGFVSDATVLSAITDRGGYSEKAYKKRVLVVRGSLTEPETFVVDSGGTLDGRLRDFKLQARDIVYVSRRPWVKAEELLDEAASSFIQGAVTTWAGVNVGPIITKRLLPRARPK